MYLKANAQASQSDFYLSKVADNVLVYNGNLKMYTELLRNFAIDERMLKSLSIEELIRIKCSPEYSNFITYYNQLVDSVYIEQWNIIEKLNKYGKAISEIYHYMDSEYRNEYFFKNTILNQLLIKRHDIYNTAVLTELPAGESKADFIMINGRGIVYEIKTDLDNLLRFESQIKDYYKVFSHVHVVIGKSRQKKFKNF